MNFSLKRMASCSRLDKVKLKEKEEMKISLLDLPKLSLDCIFDRLSPEDLCSMVRVCWILREMCSSDHLWEKHLQQKWGKVIGEAAYREWQSHVASKSIESNLSEPKKEKGLFDSLRNSRRFPWIKIKPAEKSSKVRSTSLPLDSIMAFYLALESGKFCFPAQIYYRQNGYTGVMLLCYDAQVSYDPHTDTFRARYSSQGWGTGEENIEWDRVRAPPVDVNPFMPHVSDCLDELKPGDHIEIQWRSRQELPYAWWYALIGHLESCDGNQNHCLCHETDTVVVEFNQYHPNSRWRRAMISRKHHPGVGNETDGFYGGIRKLSDEEEIAKWLSFWPNQLLIRVRFPNVHPHLQ